MMFSRERRGLLRLAINRKKSRYQREIKMQRFEGAGDMCPREFQLYIFHCILDALYPIVCSEDLMFFRFRMKKEFVPMCPSSKKT